jgi:hypothetical protein
MKRKSFLAAIGVAAAVLACQGETVQAQARTGQTNGLFGSRSLGGSSSSLGSSSRLGGGGSGLGTGGLGAGGGGLGTGGQMSNADVGALSGNERFVRGNRQPGSFVGANQGDVERFVGGGQSGGQALGITFDPQGRGATIRPVDGADGGAGRGAGRGATAARRVRAQRQVAFDYPAPRVPQVSNRLTARLARLRGLRSLGPVRVDVAGRTAILRGVVATEHDRVLAEQVALLEAGISVVQNELTVEGAPGSTPPEAAEPLLREL